MKRAAIDQYTPWEHKELELKERGLLDDHDVTTRAGLTPGRMPANEQEAMIGEKILGAEMATLSLEEHEQAIFDVHGIPQLLNEDPTKIEHSLSLMENEIRMIRNKHEYEHAKYLNEKYVNDRAFRLMFLRCDSFDVRLAAQRMVHHFKVKNLLFGEGDILGRPVHLSDLSDEDMTLLQSGYTQVLPTRDTAGRFVISIAPLYRKTDTRLITQLRVMWYMMSVTLKDEDAQRRGLVVVYSNLGTKAPADPFSDVRQRFHAQAGLPLRVAALHYCYEDASLKPFVTGLHMCCNKETRKRFRVHFGSWDNMSFKLQTFGIQMKDFPVNRDGSLSLEWHVEWIQACRYQESLEPVNSGVIVPRRFDVLFGRGIATREHTGNLRAAHLVEMFQAEYESAGKFEKTEIAERIVGIIHESYGRFLKWKECQWEQVEYNVAREKVSHFFRQLRCRKVDGGTNTTTSVPSQTATAKRAPTVTPILSVPTMEEVKRKWK